MADNERAKQQAKAQLESIREMIAQLEVAIKESDRAKAEDAERRLDEDPLSIEVRSDWHVPGDKEASGATEYKILLCTGGPACQLLGELDEYGYPETVRLQYQDWFTPWEDYELEEADMDVLLQYARHFYYGEG